MSHSEERALRASRKPLSRIAVAGLVLAVLAALAEKSEGRIEATDTTFWFGFKDDVVIRIQPAEAGSRVDVRSTSRVGVGDLGVNAARIRRFLERLREQG